MRIILIRAHFTVLLGLAVALGIGCSQALSPSKSPSNPDPALGGIQSQLVDAIQSQLAGLPAPVPPNLDLGVIHNKTLAHFERMHDLDTPLSLDRFVGVYTRAINKTFQEEGIDFVATESLTRAFAELYHQTLHAHGTETPWVLLDRLHEAGLMTKEERRLYDAQLRTSLAGDLIPLSQWASQIRDASEIYWKETGRIGVTGTRGTQGWLKDLFVIASDMAGGIAGGLLGIAAGGAVAGPTGTAVGSVIGGSMGAGAFSGLAVAVTACTCEEN